MSLNLKSLYNKNKVKVLTKYDVEKLMEVLKSFEGRGYLFNLKNHVIQRGEKYTILNYTLFIDGVKQTLGEDNEKVANLTDYNGYEIDFRHSKKALSKLVTEFNELDSPVKMGSIRHYNRNRIVLYVDTAKHLYKRKTHISTVLAPLLLSILCWFYTISNILFNTPNKDTSFTTIVVLLTFVCLSIFHTMQTFTVYRLYNFETKLIKLLHNTSNTTNTNNVY